MQVRIITATSSWAPAPQDREHGEENAESSPQFVASYLINDRLAIDAGAIGLIADLQRQSRISDVVLSHPHMDHVASLPIFVDNVFGAHPEGVLVWCSESTENALRTHLFNGVIWPDLTKLEGEDGKHLQFRRFRTNEPFEIGKLRVTPLELNHVASTHGFLIDDGDSACAIVSDTLPLETIWPQLEAAPRLDAVLLECSFPNRLQWLADVSKHLTPRSFAEQTTRLQREAPWIAIHLKPAFAAEIESELTDLAIPNLRIGRADTVYEF